MYGTDQINTVRGFRIHLFYIGECYNIATKITQGLEKVQRDYERALKELKLCVLCKKDDQEVPGL